MTTSFKAQLLWDNITRKDLSAVHGMLENGHVNLEERDANGDSILIHAVKGGHVDIVRALLKKYVDVDVPGQDGKTALYCAVEKGYTEIVKLLLQSNPDTELSTKDDDTPLLRAVRMRNEECVRLLLEKGAKVSACDKRGDTALHIAIRARSKRITELLLRNPRHSRLLYRLNKAGESPYSMDTYHQRGILPQIYGHGNLNATDAENLLGYEIYSSALADILSEPCLITPITMGLYAKWGSGKSFLLDKLRGIEQNLRTSFQDTNVNGFDYLRNVVHLPFYLQSQGMRIQLVDLMSNQLDVADASPSKAMRQDSVLTSVSSDTRPGRKASRAMGSSHMVGGSLSGSLPGIMIVPSIPSTKEQDPLLEIDRNVRKLEAILTSKSGNFPLLNVADLKKFLPCTINLDPYLRKLIRETQHNLERHQAEMATLGGVFPPPPPPPATSSLLRDTAHDRTPLLASPARYNTVLPHHQPMIYGMYGAQPTVPYAAAMHNPHLIPGYLHAQQMLYAQQDNSRMASSVAVPLAKMPKDFFSNYIRPVILSKCSVDDVCELLSRLKGLSPEHLSEYQASIRENNISGLVLTMCDLSELQPVIKMRFGDWQLFRSAIQTLVSAETQADSQEESKAEGMETSQSIQTAQLTQSSSGISYTEHSSSASNARPQASRSLSLQDPSSNGRFGQKTELQKIRERKMRRNDSIVQQLSYEAAILKSAVSGFVEESEEEEEEEEEDVTEPSQGLLELCSVKEETKEFDTSSKDGKRPVFQLGEDSPAGSPERQPSLSSHSGQKTYTISKDDMDTLVNADQKCESQSDSEFFSSEDHNESVLNPFSSRRDSDQPSSLREITPFIKVLDRPKSQSSQGSGEFVPLLGSVQLHPTPGGSTEFVPGSNYLSLSSDTLLDIDPPAQHAEQVLTSSEATGAQESLPPPPTIIVSPSLHDKRCFKVFATGLTF
ncbi:hypothetical protein Btru_024102 [Bulinus truncatus]|nr:hypothetical protein Btru_024102 [Bulinus truncatus]